MKMEVKEAVVTYLRGVMQDAESVDEARIQIQKRLPEIEAVAKEKMQQRAILMMRMPRSRPATFR